MKVLVTGASGMLGRAIYSTLNSQHPDMQILGLSHTRQRNDLMPLDLCDEKATGEFLVSEKPDIIVHSAAIRHPETCENDHEKTDAVNVSATSHLAQYCAKSDIPLIYISTDYVFPGDKPPYFEDSETNPLNYYGVSKLSGEKVVQAAGCPNTILRIPVLYGEVESIDESAITIIAKSLLSGDKRIAMDNWASRYPTHVEDVAVVISQIVGRLAKQDQAMNGVFHYSSDETYTKYEIANLIADAFSLSASHLNPANDAPAGPPRPKNTHLNHSKLKNMGIDAQRSFKDAIKLVLEPHMPKTD